MPKQALITGAAGGLGTEVTKAFLAAGYQATALTNPNNPEEASKLKEDTGHPEQLSIDGVNAFDADAVKSFVDANFKGETLHAAVFLVGGFAMGKLEDTDEAALDKMIKLNFKTAYHFSRHCLPHMADNSRMILIGARPALEPAAATALVAYSISKGMVLQLANILNDMGKERNVQAVTILPSIIDTPANREAMSDANFDDWVKPAEIAQAMVYACSAAGLKQRGGQFRMYGNV